MRRWLGEIAFVAAFIAYLWFAVPMENLRPSFRRQPPPNPFSDDMPSDPLRLLPAPSVGDPVFAIKAPEPRAGDGVGTGFAIGAGVWATARHVVDGCGRVFVSAGGHWVPAREVAMHRLADVAVIWAAAAAPPLPLSNRLFTIEQPGFHIGFPQSKPASVRSELIGRVRVKWTNSNAFENGITWAEKERVPEFEGWVGGISGAPALDERGRVVGITIGASARRGRLTTSAVENLLQIASIDRAIVSPLPLRFGPDNFAKEATRLRDIDTITQVYCRHAPGAPVPRRPRARG